MAIYTDIITDENGDIQIVNGDIKIGESDSQHIEHIMIAGKGQFRQFPLIGVGIQNMINGTPNRQLLRQTIQLQLESDGYNVRAITISPTNALNINIDAERKNTD